MKAMIFAAGLGTRLRPLTNDKPKALVPYKGKTLLEHIILKLKKYNFTHLIINIHHFAYQIVNFLEQNNNFGLKISISNETSQLLDTGGGLFNARHFFADTNFFLVHNVDIITDFDLHRMIDYHTQNQALATLATQKRKSSKVLCFDKQGLCKWKDLKNNKEKIARQCYDCHDFAFSGIQILSPKIFNFMHKGKYSVIDTYLKAAKTEKIINFDHTGSFWRDMGHPESFID